MYFPPLWPPSFGEDALFQAILGNAAAHGKRLRACDACGPKDAFWIGNGEVAGSTGMVDIRWSLSSRGALRQAAASDNAKCVLNCEA
jgi:hypothetical protein